MVRTKRGKSKRKEELITKKIEGKLFKKHWKLERKVKKPSVQVDGLCSLKGNSFLGKT